MVDHITVCCMCGDVGFRDKLFRCLRCLYRFQHPYCSNYYDVDDHSGSAMVCDWCRCEERNAAARGAAAAPRRKHDRDDGAAARAKPPAAASSSRPTGRRYKLLKDVLC